MRDLTQTRLLEAVRDQALAQPDAPLLRALAGGCLAAVDLGDRAGLAAVPSCHAGPQAPWSPPDGLPATAHNLVRLLAQEPEPFLLARSLALAAAGALLPAPDAASQRKGQDYILEHGRGKSVAVVGHFPFVERMGPEFRDFAVLELSPRAGDLPAARAAEVLGRADLAAITGMTLVNGTLAGLLALLRPGARVLLLGPSVPFAPALFACGITALAGARVVDPAAALAGVAADRPFKALPGVRHLLWERPENFSRPALDSAGPAG